MVSHYLNVLARPVVLSCDSGFQTTSGRFLARHRPRRFPPPNHARELEMFFGTPRFRRLGKGGVWISFANQREVYQSWVRVGPAGQRIYCGPLAVVNLTASGRNARRNEGTHATIPESPPNLKRRIRPRFVQRVPIRHAADGPAAGQTMAGTSTGPRVFLTRSQRGWRACKARTPGHRSRVPKASRQPGRRQPPTR